MDRTDTILIVDDEQIGRDTLEALLFGGNYQLYFAEDGPKALDKVEETAPDLILLDVMMPGMDGFSVCEVLKKNDQWRHIPIILVTALDSKEELARGFEAGADDFLSKPVSSLELRARVRSMLRLKHQFDELQAMLQLREDLANMIVHDMRSPLTAMLGLSELLKQGLIKPGSADIDTLYHQVLRLNGFVNDLLTMAKMKSGKLLINRTRVGLDKMIDSLERGYRVVAESKGINFVVRLPATSQSVELDANLFQRVLDNLLSNAMKYSMRDSTVTLTIEYPASEPYGLSVIVSDEGVGIPEERRKYIFEKFETLEQDPLPEPVAHLGLGLAFCKMVVDAHGGRISVQANQPKGSIFSVEL
ncbi:MAG TPA: response regulator [Anaerolineae bacterium]|nr:response regulator [Anaerolineae bacterium]HMR66654.1 response regulator [Anaerolineae bacterium]